MHSHRPVFEYFLQAVRRPVVAALIGITVAVLAFGFIVSRASEPTARIDINPLADRHHISSLLLGLSSGSNLEPRNALNRTFEQLEPSTLRVMEGYDPGARMLLELKDGKITVLGSDDVAYQPKEPTTVSVSAAGSSLRVSVNGQRVLSASDQTFTDGKTALLTSYDARSLFDDVRVSPSNARSKTDDFSGGSLSDMWSIADPVSTRASRWFLENGKLVHEGNHHSPLLLGPNMRSGTFETSITPGDSGDPFTRGFVGMGIRMQDNRNGYVFLWRSSQEQPTYSAKPWGVADFDGVIDTAERFDIQPVLTANVRAPASYTVDTYRSLPKHMRGYVEVGNEHYLADDTQLTPDAYVAHVRDLAEKLHAESPRAKVGAHLNLDVSNSTWDTAILDGTADVADFYVLHVYPYNVSGTETRDQLLAAPSAFFSSYITHFGTGSITDQIRNELRWRAPNRVDEIELLVTEFNTGNETLGKNTTSALATAEYMLRFAQTGVTTGQFLEVGVYGSHWGVSKDDGSLRPSGEALSLLRQTMGTKTVRTEVSNSPTRWVGGAVHVPDSNMALVDSITTLNDTDDEMTIYLFNRSEESREADVHISHAFPLGDGKKYTLSGPSFESTNEGEHQVGITEESFTPASPAFDIRLPAASVTALVIPVDVRGLPEMSDDSILTLLPGETPMLTTRNGSLQATAAFSKIPPELGRRPRAARADVDGDGRDEYVLTSDKDTGPLLYVLDESRGFKRGYEPFHHDFRGGVSLAVGDIDGDPEDEVVVAQASQGEAWVKTYDWQGVHLQEIASWRVFGSVESGASVALGDIDGDALDEVIVGAGPGGGPHIRTFEADGTPLPLQFFAFHPGYRGGVHVSSGDVTCDGRAEFTVSQIGNEEAWVKTYASSAEHPVLGQWRAYDAAPVGAETAMIDIDNDGIREVVTGPGTNGAPHIRAFEVNGTLTRFGYLADKQRRGGARIGSAVQRCSAE